MFLFTRGIPVNFFLKLKKARMIKPLVSLFRILPFFRLQYAFFPISPNVSIAFIFKF